MNSRGWRDWLTMSGNDATIVAAPENHLLDVCGVVRVGPEDGDAAAFSLWVREDARGRRIGERLVGSAMKWAGDDAHDLLVLDVDVHDAAAIHLYRRMGFERIDQSWDGDIREDRYDVSIVTS
jgi:ribosomal protein S18 acetylase RimI-like enzyme